MRHSSIAIVAVLAACGAKKTAPAPVPRDDAAPIDAAAPVDPPPPADAAVPLSGLGSVLAIMPRLTLECPSAVVAPHGARCLAETDATKRITFERRFRTAPGSDRVEHVTVGLSWKTGARPALCDTLPDVIAAYVGDLTRAPTTRLLTLLREHSSNTENWFEYRTDERTIYFHHARVRSECLVLLTSDLDQTSENPTGPLIPVE